MTGNELDKLAEDVHAAQVLHARIHNLHRMAAEMRNEAAEVSICVAWNNRSGSREKLYLNANEDDGLEFRAKVQKIINDEIEYDTLEFLKLKIETAVQP